MTGNAAVLFSALVQSLSLPMLLLIFVTLFLKAHQTIYVGFYRQQFPYGGQLFQAQLVKGFLGSFMKQNFCLMLCQKLFRVTGFPPL